MDERSRGIRLGERAVNIDPVAALLQPLSGDYSAKDVADRHSAKLAAMESHCKTEKGAELIIGGIPDVENQEVDYGIKFRACSTRYFCLRDYICC